MYAISIYVPSTYAVDKTLTPAQYAVRVARVQKWVASQFGGFTATQGVGGWQASTGELVVERVTIVTTFTTDSNAHETFCDKAQSYAKAWGQDAVTVTVAPLKYTFVTAA